MATTTTFTEGFHTAEFMVSERPNHGSRETAYVRAGDLSAGAVLGRTVTAVADAGNTGDGVIGTFTADADAPQGLYILTCTAAAADAGTFEVIAPDGTNLGDLTVAVAYDNVIQCTVADGAADWAVDDLITCTVGVVEFDTADTDGGDTAYGVLYGAVDASAAAAEGVMVVRDAIIEKTGLSWGSGIDVGEQAGAYGDLNTRGIVAR